MANKSNTVVSTVPGNQPQAFSWATHDRKQASNEVRRHQRRIFKATKAGDMRMVRATQKTLVQSLHARFLAVLRVTSSTGKLTPGIDGKVYADDGAREILVLELRDMLREYKPLPTRTVFIPKPDGTKRKLGIPAIRDRAMQALVLLALEPVWEARFEPNSFGFRPGRSPIDAVQYIGRMLLSKKGRRVHPGWVLDADISKCFDNIDHDALLEKLKDSPFAGYIRAWLKSGTVSRVGFSSTLKGTPQGGVISPLLANIALDGMERLFGIYTKTSNYYAPSSRAGLNKDVALYRYADDFIVLAPSKDVLENHVIPTIKAFLSKIGLDLNEAKTRVVNVSDGFDFLGFSFRRFFRKNGAIKTFLYQPRRDRLDLFMRGLKDLLKKTLNMSVQDVIAGLNRRIRGFCNYFKWSNAHNAFSYLGHRIYWMLYHWVRHRHQKKRGARWLKYHYWKPVKGNQWLFHFKGVSLAHPYTFTTKWWLRPPVKIHTSPHDPDEVEYWAKRAKQSTWTNPLLENVE